MLVLTRKINQSLLVGAARIVVLAVSGARVTLGVDAPSETLILREELVQRP